MRDEFLDVRLSVEIDVLMDVREVPAQNRAARHQQGLGIRRAGCRKISEGHEISGAFAGLEPVLVEGGDRERVRYIDLIDEFAHLLDDLRDLLQPHGIDRRAAGPLAAVHADRGGRAADQEIRVRILAAEDGQQLCDLALPGERIEIMRNGHEVGFRRQFVERAAPVGIGENAELSRFHQLL